MNIGKATWKRGGSCSAAYTRRQEQLFLFRRINFQQTVQDTHLRNRELDGWQGQPRCFNDLHYLTNGVRQATCTGRLLSLHDQNAQVIEQPSPDPVRYRTFAQSDCNGRLGRGFSLLGPGRRHQP